MKRVHFVWLCCVAQLQDGEECKSWWRRACSAWRPAQDSGRDLLTAKHDRWGPFNHHQFEAQHRARTLPFELMFTSEGCNSQKGRLTVHSDKWTSQYESLYSPLSTFSSINTVDYLDRRHWSGSFIHKQNGLLFRTSSFIICIFYEIP